jgi:hypothetical protein
MKLTQMQLVRALGFSSGERAKSSLSDAAP